MKINLLFLSFVFVVFSMPFIAAAEVMPLGTQGIFITDISTDTVCPGDNIDVDFSCSSITPTGTLSVELSDAAGSFASPVVIATVAASSSGTITSTVPVNTPEGSGYRLRVTSSAPVFTGSPNGVNIRVNPLPQPVIVPSSITICQGDLLTLNSDQQYLVTNWHINGGYFTNTSSVNINNAMDGDCFTLVAFNTEGCSGTSDLFCINVLPLPEPVITSVGPYCNDGTCHVLTATPTGGTFNAPFGLSQNIFCPPTSGTYPITYTYTDQNGCTGIVTQDIEVVDVPHPEVTYSGSTTFCEGDSVILDAGSGFVTYHWNLNGNVISGNQTITVHGDNFDCYTVSVIDGSGCYAQSEEVCITVLQLPEPVITASGPLGVCDGECVTLSADPGYNCYDWSTGEITQSIMACDSATYSLQVCGVNGCTSEWVSVPITIYPNPVPVITANGPTTFCEGNCVTLSVDMSFTCGALWNTGSTAYAVDICEESTISVFVCDGNGCTGSSADTTVHVYPAPEPVITVNGSTLTCTPSFPSYQWNYNGLPISTGGTNQTYPNAIECGNYTVTVTDVNGCTATSDTVYCPLSVDELTSNDLKIYPNPAINTITIQQLDGRHFSFVKIINALGEVVYDGSIINQQSTISIAGLSSGIYFITLSDGEKQVSTRFVKVYE